MKVTERDAILIRLDERSKNHLELTEKQEKHLSILNNRVSKNEMNIDRNYNRINGLEVDMSNVPRNPRLSKRQVAGGGVGIVTLVILALTILGNISGWW